jgi:putative acetyltransferase
MSVTISLESPDQPDVIALLTALDDYLATLYPPEDNHILSVQELLHPSIAFFVARADATAVGCGALRVLNGDQGEIKRMYVSPALRGQRIGVKLLDAINAKAAQRGLRELLLEAGTHQPEALRLYINAGYEFCDAFGEYAALASVGTSVFMRRAL